MDRMDGWMGYVFVMAIYINRYEISGSWGDGLFWFNPFCLL